MLDHVGIHEMDMKWHTIWVLSKVQLHGSSAIWVGRESIVMLGALLGSLKHIIPFSLQRILEYYGKVEEKEAKD